MKHCVSYVRIVVLFFCSVLSATEEKTMCHSGKKKHWKKLARVCKTGSLEGLKHYYQSYPTTSIDSLLYRGTGKKRKTKCIGTPLKIVLEKGYWDCAHWLLERGAPIKHKEGEVPFLHYTVMGDMDADTIDQRCQVMKMLLQKGVRVNTVVCTIQEEKETALGYLIDKFARFTQEGWCMSEFDKERAIRCAEILIDHGAVFKNAYSGKNYQGIFSCFLHDVYYWKVTDIYAMEDFGYWQQSYSRDVAWKQLQRLMYRRIYAKRACIVQMLLCIKRRGIRMPAPLRGMIADTIIQDAVEDVIGALGEAELKIDSNTYSIVDLMQKYGSKLDTKPFMFETWMNDWKEFTQSKYQSRSNYDYLPRLPNNQIQNALNFEIERKRESSFKGPFLWLVAAIHYFFPHRG
jgi:hypothetical protein